MNKIETGSQLKSWRKDNHLTQKKLAELTNYSTDRISKIESKDIKVPMKLLDQVEKLDMLYYPPIKELPPLAKQWESIEHIRNFFPGEFNIIEKEMIELLSIKVNTQSLDIPEAYLKFIGSALGNIIKIANLDYEDEETYKNEVNSYLVDIKKEARFYLKKK